MVILSVVSSWSAPWRGWILFVFRLGVLVVRLEGMPCAVIAGFMPCAGPFAF